MANGLRQPNSEHQLLLERHRELRALDVALASLHDTVDGVSRTPQGGLLAYTGSGGLGKTTLMAQARARACAQGFTVLSGKGGETEHELAFRVVRQLMQPTLAAMDETTRRDLLGSWYDIVATALGLEAAGTAPIPDPTGVRDGLDWVMTRLTVKKGPIVLLLDDLQWADAESLGWLASFAPRTADLPLLIIAAYRPDELPPEATSFRSLFEGHGSRPYALAPLSPAAVARIVRHELGAGAEDAFCEECWTVTGGSPFETVELAIRLGEDGLKGTQDELPTMRNLASAVKGPGLLDQLRRLGTTTVRFAWAAAVLGTSISPHLAAAIAVVSSEDAVEATEQLRARRILADTPGPDEGLEFVHPLIATTIYRAIPSHLRVGLHNAAAMAVRAAGLGPTAAARHLLEVPAEGKTEAVDCLREAAREYLRAGAPEAARRVLTRALQEPPHPEERAELLNELASSTFLIDPAATVSHLREALSEPEVDPDLHASIVYRLTQALAHTDQMAEASAVAEQEARQAPNARIKLRMQADHFVWSMFRTDEPDSPARSRRLAKLARQLPGRGLEERYIQGLRAWDALVRGEPRQTVLDTAEEALRGGMSWTDENRGFEVPVSVALVFMYGDQPHRAEDLFAKGIAECVAKGWRGSHLALGNTLSGYIRYRRGCLAEAEELVRDGLRIADKVKGAVPAQWFAIGILIQTLVARGRTAEARELADSYSYGAVVPNAVIYPDPRTVYSELLLAEGRHVEAERLLTAVGDRLEARAWRNPAWCPWQLNLAYAVAPSAPDRAVRLARDAVKRARDFGAASAIGQALHTEAEVTGGTASLELYAEAVAELQRSPAAYELARALVGHGAALSRNGRVQEAADRLYQGLECAVHCGAEALAGRARDELSAAGLRPLPLRYAQTDTLTAQERRAAEMTALGKPVAVVAKELRVTEQGVRQLLSLVYRKVGTDAAGLARALETFPRPRP
ncbi:AAA family ATPase [Streptomyces spinoverrucosus]|uniref:ATP-binding protein n=1 Tax=Streptomyces spinoverrucosus TaxID=284043 RepID=UPI0018C37C54|nr:AAA family ATPase [Streptomyces spinoverrucosus]MBG0857293.1 AAA family ATPase [Streptomyces spinoverrucosus]